MFPRFPDGEDASVFKGEYEGTNYWTNTLSYEANILKKIPKSKSRPNGGFRMRMIVLFPYKIGCGAALKGPYSCSISGSLHHFQLGLTSRPLNAVELKFI